MNQTNPIKRRRGRPPKGARDPNETRQQLIRSGLEMLTEQGYSATGLEAILSRVGVPKGSFYHYFNSKEVFTKELISTYNSFFQHKLGKFLLNKDMSPLSRIRAFTEDAMEGMARYEFKRGCLVGNLGQEVSVLPDGFRQQLRQVMEEWEQLITDCLVAAQAAGEIDDKADCQALAYLFWIGWEGAVLRARLERSALPLKAFTEAYLNGIRR